VTPSLFKGDLHVHTCLSPCGDIGMSPRAIVERALEKKLDFLAISDHNSMENVKGVLDAAEQTPLTVFPAMEIASREEVHILSVFPSLTVAENVQQYVYESLADASDDSYIEDQIIANGADEVEGFCKKLLIAATTLSVKKIVAMVHEVGGLAIAAHIDRQAFGIIGQLGFIPPRVTFDALEISWRERLKDAPKRYPDQQGYTFITNSDAHYIHELGRCCTQYRMPAPAFRYLSAALAGKDGCGVEGACP
jgi:3',5'-nucleoside bisphosphate phosphatase